MYYSKNITKFSEHFTIPKILNKNKKHNSINEKILNLYNFAKYCHFRRKLKILKMNFSNVFLNACLLQKIPHIYSKHDLKSNLRVQKIK